MLKYLITKKPLIIAYADITHLSNIRVNSNSDTAFASSYIKFKIKLDTGESLVLLTISVTDDDMETNDSSTGRLHTRS